jgi:hypothetical protein
MEAVVSRTGWIGLVLFLFAMLVFRASPRGQIYDSSYALLVSHQLIHHADPSLDVWVGTLGGVDGNGRPHDYRIVSSGGRYHWFYPPGTPLLAAPFVAAASAIGAGPVDRDGHYDRRGERRLQRTLAAFAMALTGVLFFLTARELLPLEANVGLAVAVAVAGLFASPVWSTASRSLWSQTPALLLVTTAILLIVRGRRAGTSIHPWLIASLLAWAWLCRPTAALSAISIVVWAACVRRDALVPLMAGGFGWLAIFFVGFRGAYGSWLPPYFQLGNHAFGVIPEALLGNLVSPARGLLVYCPILLVVIFNLVRGRRLLPDRPLAVLALAVIALHWLLVSSHAPWWGGYGYGPRLMTDVVPWLVLLGAIGLAARLRDSTRPSRFGVASAMLLLALSIALNGIGAISRAATEWNDHQSEPDFEERLWRFDDAPFLAPLLASNDGRRLR